MHSECHVTFWKQGKLEPFEITGYRQISEMEAFDYKKSGNMSYDTWFGVPVKWNDSYPLLDITGTTRK